MTAKQIEAGNELIANFMGLKVGRDYADQLIAFGWEEEYDLEYHKSWDWLMPVIEKIEKENVGIRTFVEGENNRGEMYYWCNMRDAFSNGNTKIEAAYLAVVAFIKFHKKHGIQNKSKKQARKS